MLASFRVLQKDSGMASAASVRSVPAGKSAAPFFSLELATLAGLQSPMATTVGGSAGEGVRGTVLGSMSEEGGLGRASDPMSVSDALDPESHSTSVSKPDGRVEGCRETKRVGMLTVARYQSSMSAGQRVGSKVRAVVSMGNTTDHTGIRCQ